TAINITGLEADGNAVDIRAEVCKNGQTTCPDLIKTALFTAPDACDEPQGEPCVTYPSERSVDDITTSAATINWSAAEDALYYQVRVRVRLTSSWSSWYYFDYSYDNQLNIIGLSANTRYQFRVRTRCPQGWTRWSPNQNFYTPASLIGDDELQNTTNEQTLSLGESNVKPTQIFQVTQLADPQVASLALTPKMNVFPNPARQFLQIELPQPPTAPVEIYNLNGVLQLQQMIKETETQIDISTLPNGIYYLRTEVDGEMMMQRVVKM
ncbi:MAG: T9SS type A sorting domain-containing protein, partial [Saprospiraceae bacterium]